MTLGTPATRRTSPPPSIVKVRDVATSAVTATAGGPPAAPSRPRLRGNVDSQQRTRAAGDLARHAAGESRLVVLIEVERRQHVPGEQPVCVEAIEPSAVERRHEPGYAVIRHGAD